MRYTTILLLLFISHLTFGQYYPSDNVTLNFNSIMFEFPWVGGCTEYEIIITNQSNSTNRKLQSEANRVKVDNLEFGTSYTWKVRGISNSGDQIQWSSDKKFTIGSSDQINPQLYKYAGKKKVRSKVNKGVLFFDYGMIGVNRAGKPIWFLPKADTIPHGTLIRDLKFTNDGTFTLLIGEKAVELDRNGNLLWEAPNDGIVNGEHSEHYHHEFSKLENGNYLVLGQDYIQRKIPNSPDSIKTEFGTIIEYNPAGEIVWSWNSNSYFNDPDLFSRPRGNSFNTRTHMNACSMSGDLVFASYRDISRIIVIDKKSGKVIESYGGHGYFEEPHSATGFFRRQHSALQLSDGNLAVFNNDSIMDPEVVSSIVVFSRINNQSSTSQKLLDFKMDFDTLSDGKSAKTGNVLELENGNLLANLGQINRAVEISREGELLWTMEIEKFDTVKKKWNSFPQYRVSYTPSLYPYESTFLITQNEYSKRKRNVTIRVFNVGTKTDTYDIQLGKKNKILDTLKIAPNTYQDVNIQLKTKKELHFQLKSAHKTLSEIIQVPGFI